MHPFKNSGRVSFNIFSNLQSKRVSFRQSAVFELFFLSRFPVAKTRMFFFRAVRAAGLSYFQIFLSFELRISELRLKRLILWSDTFDTRKIVLQNALRAGSPRHFARIVKHIFFELNFFHDLARQIHQILCFWSVWARLGLSEVYFFHNLARYLSR